MKAIIIGKSGSGKTTVQKLLKLAGFKSCVSHTTRPKRENEIDGVDYHFVNEEEFEKISEDMIVREYFPAVGWHYGKTNSALEETDIIVTTPGEILSIENFLKSINESYKIFYLYLDDETRKQRSIRRGDSLTEIERRIDADNKDFFRYFGNYSVIENRDIIDANQAPDRIAAIIASEFTVTCIKHHKDLLTGKEYQIEDLLIPMLWKQSRSTMFTILNELGEVHSYSTQMFTID